MAVEIWNRLGLPAAPVPSHQIQRVKTIILATCSIYFVVVLYQIFIITYQIPKAF